MSVAHPAHLFAPLRCVRVELASGDSLTSGGRELRCFFSLVEGEWMNYCGFRLNCSRTLRGDGLARRQKTKVLSKRQAPCCIACLMSGCSGCVDAATSCACVLWGTESPVSSRFLSIVRDGQRGERVLSPCGGWAQQSAGMADNVMKHIFESYLRLCWSSLIDLLCGKLKWVIYSVLSEPIDMQVKAV